MSIGVKRCVDRTRATEGTQIDALAFALFYSAQNVAALAAGLAVDALRARTAAWAAPLALLGAKPTAFRAVFLAGALATALSAVLVLLFLDDVDEGVVRDAPQADGVFDAVRVVWKEPRFRRFARLALILLGVSMIYRHLDNTLPKYMVRVFGPKAPYGEYYAIEPLFVVFAVPIFGTLLADAPVYSVLIAGTAVAGTFCVFFALGLGAMRSWCSLPTDVLMFRDALTQDCPRFGCASATKYAFHPPLHLCAHLVHALSNSSIFLRSTLSLRCSSSR